MQATIEHQLDENRMLIRPLGSWVIDEARRLDTALRELFSGAAASPPRELTIDLSAMSAMDTAGAYLLARAERRVIDSGGHVEWRVADASRVALLERVRDVLASDEKPLRPPTTTVLQDIGATVVSVGADARRLLLILGGTVQELGGILLRPSEFRASAVGGRSKCRACGRCRSSC
jgi:phospholipid/cholesterol/gamma-HCH transport system permease protein